MIRSQYVTALLLLIAVSGCASGRLVRLEKDVEELKESLASEQKQSAELKKELAALRRESDQQRGQTPPAETDEGLAAEAVPARTGVSEEVDLELPTAPMPGSAFEAPEPAAAGKRPEADAELVEMGPAPVPGDVSMLSSADDLYGEAFSNFQKASYHKAILQFSVFVERYPKHDLTDNAFYWMGECWYGLRNYPRAIAAYETVLERFPKGNKAPDSLLKKGYSLQRAGREGEALAAFRELIRRYPQSSSATKAQTKLKELQVARS